MHSLEVAQNILDQLGGSKFKAMTGARHFIITATSLGFRLPTNFAKDGINGVRIDLTEQDTYNVLFTSTRGTGYRVVKELENVYVEDLTRVFTDVTGLQVRL